MARWSIPFEEVADKKKLEIATAVRVISFELFSSIVLRSPVDTGRFRANWNLSYGSADQSVSNATDKSGTDKINDLERKLMTLPVGGVYWFANSLPYALVLEYGLYPNPPVGGKGLVKNGYSSSAPSGMVRLSVRELRARIQSILQ